MKMIVNGTIETVNNAAAANNRPFGTPRVSSLGADHAQKPRDDAVATAIGGASAIPASKLFFHSLTACAADSLSSLVDLEMAGTEIREIEAMVPGLRLEAGVARTLGFSGPSSQERVTGGITYLTTMQLLSDRRP